METKTAEGVVDSCALPKIKPFRPFAKLRERYQQLERAVESARKRGEQLSESITPIAARVASRAGSVASNKAAPKPSSNKRVNTLRRMTAEVAHHRKANRSAASKTDAAPEHTRSSARNTEQPRKADQEAVSSETKSAPPNHKRVVSKAKPLSPSRNSDG